MPLRGNAAKIMARVDCSPVASPRQNGELVESASSTGSSISTPSITCSAASGVGTATCTCMPNTSSRRATYCSISISIR
jgi:hypothetical protein